MAKTIEARQRIVEQAKRLFNLKGYKRVSLREIAEAASTTIGNLTYHFPQKENLIMAIQEELHAEFADEFFHEQRGEAVLNNLYRSFRNAQRNRENDPFYFQNLLELCSDSKAILENNQVFRKKLYDFYLSTFTQLRTDGLMRTDIAADGYQTLAYTVVVLTTVWIQNHSPYYDEALPKDDLAGALSDLMAPYFTALGRDRARPFES